MTTFWQYCMINWLVYWSKMAFVDISAKIFLCWIGNGPVMDVRSSRRCDSVFPTAIRVNFAQDLVLLRLCHRNCCRYAVIWACIRQIQNRSWRWIALENVWHWYSNWPYSLIPCSLGNQSDIGLTPDALPSVNGHLRKSATNSSPSKLVHTFLIKGETSQQVHLKTGSTSEEKSQTSRNSHANHGIRIRCIRLCGHSPDKTWNKSMKY
jgi:hypothetical protein